MGERDSARCVNSMAIERLSREEMDRHRGEYAVFVGGAIDSYHATSGEALETALAKHRLGAFSIQRIEPQPIEFTFTKRLAAILVRTTSAPPR